MSPPPYSFSRAVGSWAFDPLVTTVLLFAAAVYIVGVCRARRRQPWPWWRTACFLVLGLGGTAVCTMSSLAVYQHAELWALAAQLTLLVSLIPVGIALGDPIDLARAAMGDPARVRLDRLLATAPIRVVTFPVFSAVLTTVFMVAVFFSGLLGTALRHGAVMDALYLAALVVGCLAALPMLGAELLPAWCTEPFRLLFAFVDGLVDAIPGVLVMTTGHQLAGGWFVGRPDDPNWNVHVAGALMLSLSELVALPIFFVVFFRWAAREGAFAAPTRPEHRSGQPGAPVATAEDVDEPVLQRPWWETEGLGRRSHLD